MSKPIIPEKNSEAWNLSESLFAWRKNRFEKFPEESKKYAKMFRSHIHIVSDFAGEL